MYTLNNKNNGNKYKTEILIKKISKWGRTFECLYDGVLYHNTTVSRFLDVFLKDLKNIMKK